MDNATKALHALKRAANYSKLAMGELGPKSFKKGQGALLKVIYKFNEEGALNKKTAEKILGWRGKDLRHVAKKAEDNGYIQIVDPEYAFTMSLTDKGAEVTKKRLEAEDRAAEAVFEQLSADEIDTLIALTNKISDTCEGLGIDYSRIEKKTRDQKRRGDKKCCAHHRHHHHHGHGDDGKKFVFIFK